MKNRNKRKLIMYVLMIAVLVTTVAYAALQTSLNINGTATKRGGKWNIYFNNPTVVSEKGDAELTLPDTFPTNTTNFDFNVKVVKPADSVTFTVDVVNDGTINAVLDSITLSGITEAATHEVIFNIAYADGTNISEGDLLESGETRKLSLSVKYDEKATTLASENVVLNLGITLIYTQIVGEGSGDSGSGGESGGGDSGNTGNTYTDPILAGSDPNLLNNSLVPVVYNGSNWVVADTTTEWYNYAEQEWANAVILESGVTKNVGDTVIVPTATSTTTEVKAMYVWIPRYEYKITGTYGTHTNGTAGTAELPGEIEVNFIPTTQTTATSGYILHPAFTWDNDSNGTIATNEHISGMWVGKFETTGTASTPTILPNLVSLREQNVSTQFAMAQKFGTYLTNSTNTDSHMMKNSEWGAVAYLSQSIYGKYGNSIYTGSNKEVYINNSDSYYTGRSGGSSDETATETGTCYYDNITNRGNGTGSCGGGASTTGNIYGVYDMSGGSYEYVMGYLTIANWNYESNPNSYFGWTTFEDWAGFTSKPDNKYFDAYISDTESTTACNGGICYGHALSETSGWYSDDAYFFYGDIPWFIRGGYCYGATNAGVFSFDGNDGSTGIGFRGVLLVPGA